VNETLDSVGTPQRIGKAVVVVGNLATLIFPAKRPLMLQLKGLLCTEPSILIELLAVWYIVLSEHHCVLTAVRTPTPVATSCTVLPVVVVAIIFYH
jgi:hypothetical protein